MLADLKRKSILQNRLAVFIPGWFYRCFWMASSVTLDGVELR